MSEQIPIPEQIARRHLEANEALCRRDFETYCNLFADDLRYTQANGITIGKAELVKDIRSWFSRIKTAESQFDQLQFLVEGDRVKEVLVQTARVKIRIFGVFTRNTGVKREGIYEWKKENDLWQIFRVKVLKEEYL